MNDYHLHREPVYAPLRNSLEGILYSERGNTLVGSLNVIAGSGFLVSGALAENPTVAVVSYVSSGLFYLSAILQYYSTRKGK